MGTFAAHEAAHLLQTYLTGTFILPGHALGNTPPPFVWALAEAVAALENKKQIAPPHLPETHGFTEAAIYDTYAQFVQDHGSRAAQDALAAGNQVIVGLRIEGNTRENQGRGVYRDRMAIIWKDPPPKAPNGAPVLVPTKFTTPPPKLPAGPVKHGFDFKANTQPSAQYEDHGTTTKEIKSKKTGKMIKVKVVNKILDPTGKEVTLKKLEGSDVKHEGRRALGELAPGTYTFHSMDKTFLGAKYLGSSNDQVVQRDVTHDGTFSDDDVWTTPEGATVVEKGNFAIYIHKGGVNNTWSAGCQTLPPQEHTGFFSKIRKTQKDFYYVLVTLK